MELGCIDGADYGNVLGKSLGMRLSFRDGISEGNNDGDALGRGLQKNHYQRLSLNFTLVIITVK